MGADFVMMGRYFAMTYESPTPKVSIGGRIYKPYWGEGSNRARNWQRYNQSSETEGGLKFEEGVDAYVPIVGSLREVVGVTTAKLKSTMCNTGALTLKEFTDTAILTRISEQSFVEGGTSNVLSLDKDLPGSLTATGSFDLCTLLPLKNSLSVTIRSLAVPSAPFFLLAKTKGIILFFV
jgi:IMP dehydrogenase